MSDKKIDEQIRKIITRRDFLRDSSRGAAGLALGVSLTASAANRSVALAAGQAAEQAGGSAADKAATEAVAEATTKTSKVVLVRHAEAMDSDGNYNGDVITQMLDEAVTKLLEIEDPAECWRSLLAADDILGIKTNVWPNLHTPKSLEQALVKRAEEVGIASENISVDDHGVLHDPVFQNATALINARPLRTHHWSGIGGCIKNYIMFVNEPWTWHDDSCADLGGLWNLPIVQGKTRLNVLVVLNPLFHGIGPHHFDTQHVWPYKGLLVSTDPVALDAIGLQLLAEKRKRFFERPPRGGTSSKHVRLAETRHGVGVATLDRIELIKVGWMEDALI